MPSPTSAAGDSVQDTEISYDELPYQGNPVRYSHPDTLATVAALAGVRPPAIDGYRVLELGCAEGGNLLPMAEAMPGATFVGVDLSRRQIEVGKAVAAAAGLANVELRHASITDIDAGWGQFDFVLCHGVYSWVPPAVQEAILDVCRRNLAPGGLAYVSYNVYPGWHLRGLVRELLQFHVAHLARRLPPEAAGRFADRRAQAAEARGFLDFMAEAAAAPGSFYPDVLEAEAKLMARERDAYVYHEYLEATNQPIYFHQFADRLAAKGLRWVGEPPFSSARGAIPAEARKRLADLAGDRLALEQYLDFVQNRAFRRSVIAREDSAGAAVVGAAVLAAEEVAVRGMSATAVLLPESAQPDLRAGVEEKFSADEEPTLSTGDPAAKAALVALARAWPEAVAFEDLGRRVGEMIGESVGDDAAGQAHLARTLLHCYRSGVMELHVHPATFARRAGPRPRAGRLARLQAAEGMPVVNRRHCVVSGLSDFDLLVLQHLDGSRDREALLGALAGGGAVTLEGPGGTPLTDPAQIRHLLAPQLDPALRRLELSALLVE